jgi:hypothetical protein
VEFSDILKIANNAFRKYAEPIGEYLPVVQIKVSCDTG